LVARFVDVTVALGTAAPVESRTVPVMLAKVVWEFAGPAESIRRATAHDSTRNGDMKPPSSISYTVTRV
jgi:hypothetical protein